MGGELVRLHLNMADVDVEGSFGLVDAVFGTFFAVAPRTPKSAASATSLHT